MLQSHIVQSLVYCIVLKLDMNFCNAKVELTYVYCVYVNV